MGEWCGVGRVCRWARTRYRCLVILWVGGLGNRLHARMFCAQSGLAFRFPCDAGRWARSLLLLILVICMRNALFAVRVWLHSSRVRLSRRKACARSHSDGGRFACSARSYIDIGVSGVGYVFILSGEMAQMIEKARAHKRTRVRVAENNTTMPNGEQFKPCDTLNETAEAGLWSGVRVGSLDLRVANGGGGERRQWRKRQRNVCLTRKKAQIVFVFFSRFRFCFCFCFCFLFLFLFSFLLKRSSGAIKDSSPM